LLKELGIFECIGPYLSTFFNLFRNLPGKS